MPTISKVFVDTNVFVALRDENDSTHKRAKRLLLKLNSEEATLFTSSDVIGETLTVLSKKLGKSHAVEFARKVGVMVEEIFITEVIHQKARELFLRAGSKNISFIDCSSVIAMKSAKIPVAFTFDQHFKTLGVKLLRE